MLEQLQEVRRAVDALRVALQSPAHEEIDQCLPKLEQAVACLTAIEKELSGRTVKKAEDPPEIGLQLLSLRNELEVAQRLVIHGSAFCESWGRMLGVAAGGYMPTGEAAALDAHGSLSVEG